MDREKTQRTCSALNHSRDNRRFSALAVLIFILAMSCATRLPVIPDDFSASQIIQKAQERSDGYDWKGAQYCYRILLERYPDNPELVLEATYEIAFIEYKLGHKDTAKAGMQAVLEIYRGTEAASLPQTWKVLAEKILAKLK